MANTALLKTEIGIDSFAITPIDSNESNAKALVELIERIELADMLV